MANTSIRTALRVKNMAQWQLAELCGVSEQTIYRMLRKELPEEKKRELLSIIEKGEPCKDE